MSNSDMPAMPQPITENQYGGVTSTFEHDPYFMGLTKREHFAGLAMQGFMANWNSDYAQLPSCAVQFADALLKELEK